MPIAVLACSENPLRDPVPHQLRTQHAFGKKDRCLGSYAKRAVEAWLVELQHDNVDDSHQLPCTEWFEKALQAVRG